MAPSVCDTACVSVCKLCKNYLVCIILPPTERSPELSTRRQWCWQCGRSDDGGRGSEDGGDGDGDGSDDGGGDEEEEEDGGEDGDDDDGDGGDEHLL